MHVTELSGGGLKLHGDLHTHPQSAMAMEAHSTVLRFPPTRLGLCFLNCKLNIQSFRRLAEVPNLYKNRNLIFFLFVCFLVQFTVHLNAFGGDLMEVLVCKERKTELQTDSCKVERI